MLGVLAAKSAMLQQLQLLLDLLLVLESIVDAFLAFSALYPYQVIL